MWKLTLIFGILLVLLGIGSYAATGGASWTALIPALFFGLPLLICGFLARREKLRMHAMHVAALVGLLGVLGGLGMSLPKILSGSELDRLAIWSQFTMGILSLLFVAACVNSFIQARRQRQSAS